MKEEYKGQFPSKNCECHIQEVYGFVPEADCPEHDTKQFLDFLDEIKRIQRQEIIEEIKEALDIERKKPKDIISLYMDGFINNDNFLVWLSDVNEIINNKLKKL